MKKLFLLLSLSMFSLVSNAARIKAYYDPENVLIAFESEAYIKLKIMAVANRSESCLVGPYHTYEASPDAIVYSLSDYCYRDLEPTLIVVATEKGMIKLYNGDLKLMDLSQDALDHGVNNDVTIENSLESSENKTIN